MRNRFTRFVWLTVFFIAVLAMGIAKTLAADSSPEGSNGAAGATVQDGAGAPGGSGASVSVLAGPATEVATVPTLNAAKWQGLMAVMLPLIIAFFKSHIPEDKRKWIPVVAPVLGEIVSALLTSLPHGTGAVAGLAAVGLREVKDQHLPGNSTGGDNKGGNANGIVTAMGIAFMLLFFCGGLAGCGHLDPQGIYKGDKFAYDTDAVIDGAYTALDGFVQWYDANHEVVDEKWPEVTKFAEQLKNGEGDQWVDDALDLRDAYSKNPSAENRTKLQQAVAVIKTALAKVAVYQARLATAKPAASQTTGEAPTPLALKIQARDGTNYIGQYLGMIAEHDGRGGVGMFSATSGQLLRWITFNEFKAVYVDRTKREYQN